VVIGFLDYKRKLAGIGPVIIPDGNMEAQIEEMKAFGRTITGKYPEQGIR
jgi:hypothetical protein